MFWIARLVVLFAAYCSERTDRKCEEFVRSLVTWNASAPTATTPTTKRSRARMRTAPRSSGPPLARLPRRARAAHLAEVLPIELERRVG